MNEDEKIKELKIMVNHTNMLMEQTHSEMATWQRRYNELKKEADALQKQLELLSRKDEIKLTDHAIIRYLERVSGITVRDLEKSIITDELKGMVKTLGGNGKYPMGEHQLVMKNYTIVTIV